MAFYLYYISGTKYIYKRDGTTKRSNEENKKHKILVHGWLSATFDLLFRACLLALSPSGRHGRTTAAVCTCCCCCYGVVAVLRLVVVLPRCYYCCSCAREELKKQTHIYAEKTRTRKYKKECRKQKKSWNGPASNRRRRCSAGNF